MRAGRSGMSGARTPQDFTEELGRARRWGPQAPRAALPAGRPGPLGLKQIPSSRPRVHARPESPP